MEAWPSAPPTADTVAAVAATSPVASGTAQAGSAQGPDAGRAPASLAVGGSTKAAASTQAATTVAPSSATPPSVTGNPVGDLQDRVARRLGRPIVTGDVVYEFVSCALPRSPANPDPMPPDMMSEGQAPVIGDSSAAPVPLPGFLGNPSGPGGFQASVEIRALDLPAFKGTPKPSKREAKRAVAESVLANPELRAALPPPEQDSKAQQALNSPNELQNPVGALQELVQHSLRIATTADSITYTIEEVGQGSFAATVEIKTSGGEASYRGAPRGSKQKAKRAAADKALQDAAQITSWLPTPQTRSERQQVPAVAGAGAAQSADSAGAGTEPAPRGNPVGELQERLMSITRQPIQAGQIVYTIDQSVSDGKFVACVEVVALDGRPSQRGPPCLNKRDAKGAAARVFLEWAIDKSILPETITRRGRAAAVAAGAIEEGEDSNKTASGASAPNPVSQLQERVQRLVRRMGHKDDIKYSYDQSEEGFVAHVTVPVVEGCPPCSSRPSPNKREAKRAVAEAALARLAALGAA